MKLQYFTDAPPPPPYIVTGVAQLVSLRGMLRFEPRTYLATDRPASNLAVRPHLLTYFIIIMLLKN
jgi:hypothetical protein